MTRPGELEFWEFKIKELRKKVDELVEQIKAGISPEDFFKKEMEVKKFCQKLFPDKIQTYDLIYRSRFKRVWSQFRQMEVDFENPSEKK